VAGGCTQRGGHGVGLAARNAQCMEANRVMLARYGDAKVANRDTKVWHGATEKGP
jgi:hypothetical protein